VDWKLLVSFYQGENMKTLVLLLFTILTTAILTGCEHEEWEHHHGAYGHPYPYEYGHGGYYHDWHP
jgi:hypothetical protein